MDNPIKTSDWSKIPLGIIVIRMFHESTGKQCLHLHLKASEEPWFDQPRMPTYSQETSPDLEFWKWAQENLPIWEYPTPVKDGHG